MSIGPSDSDADEKSLRLAWRAVVADQELMGLRLTHDGSVRPGWWDRVRVHSLGWVSARDRVGRLVGFANVAWDGGHHAFLLDVIVAVEHRRRGAGTRMVALATEEARRAGCEWLHVDFEERLNEFYVRACGFRPTEAGLIYLQ